MTLVKLCMCRDSMEAQFLNDILNDEGIPSSIQGSNLESLRGGVPLAEASPSIWLDRQYADRALKVLQSARYKKSTGQVPSAWTCPHCGEEIEGQFTDCWKCQTPRSDAATDSENIPPPSDGNINFDLPCRSCQYNLRGVPAPHRCPECGQSILRTLLDANRYPNSINPMQLQTALLDAVKPLGAPLPAILFFDDAYANLLEHQKLQPDFTTLLSLDPLLVCRSIIRYAITFYATPTRALERLHSWNLHTPADLAKILAVVADFTSSLPSSSELQSLYKDLPLLNEQLATSNEQS